jgi:thioredoxin:protein disulfide reductase
MRESLRVALLTLLACAAPARAAPFDALLGQPKALAAEQAFAMRVAGQGRHARLELDIAPGYYLYKDKLRANGAGGVPLPLDLPAGVPARDETFGAVEVYRGALVIGVPVPRGTRVIEVEYQGCAERRLCYPPARRLLPVDGA